MVAIGLFNRITMNSYASVPLGKRLWKYCIRVGPILAICLLWYFVFDKWGVKSPTAESRSSLNIAGALPAPEDAIKLFNGIAASTKFFWGIIIGIFFAFNFLHYYYDRCFYSFRDPAIRERVGPLLFDSKHTSKS